MGDNDRELTWHNAWGTAADYEVPASGCFSWNDTASSSNWGDSD